MLKSGEPVDPIAVPIDSDELMLFDNHETKDQEDETHRE